MATPSRTLKAATLVVAPMALMLATQNLGKDINRWLSSGALQGFLKGDSYAACTDARVFTLWCSNARDYLCDADEQRRHQNYNATCRRLKREQAREEFSDAAGTVAVPAAHAGLYWENPRSAPQPLPLQAERM